MALARDFTYAGHKSQCKHYNLFASLECTLVEVSFDNFERIESTISFRDVDAFKLILPRTSRFLATTSRIVFRVSLLRKLIYPFAINKFVTGRSYASAILLASIHFDFCAIDLSADFSAITASHWSDALAREPNALEILPGHLLEC